jgi:hypothetical protein
MKYPQSFNVPPYPLKVILSVSIVDIIDTCHIVTCESSLLSLKVKIETYRNVPDIQFNYIF